jgi:hypothetical protein
VSTRFAVIFGVLIALVVVALLSLTPINTEYHRRVVSPLAPAGCYSVELGAWSDSALIDSLDVRPPSSIELTSSPNPQSGMLIDPYIALPARLAGRGYPPDSANWGYSYHGLMRVHWNYHRYGLDFYLDPGRGALRGEASVWAVGDSTHSSVAPAVLRRADCQQRRVLPN